MFLAFTAAALVAGAFAYLGALTVKVSVLVLVLKCLSALAVMVVLLAVWSLFVAKRR